MEHTEKSTGAAGHGAPAGVSIMQKATQQPLQLKCAFMQDQSWYHGVLSIASTRLLKLRPGTILGLCTVFQFMPALTSYLGQLTCYW